MLSSGVLPVFTTIGLTSPQFQEAPVLLDMRSYWVSFCPLERSLQVRAKVFKKEKRDDGVCLRERGTSWDCVREGESEREKEIKGMKVCGISRVKGRRITSEISSARYLFLV